MPTWTINLCCVAGAGAIGAVARWGTHIGVQRFVGTSWPWATLVINVLGCFIIGLAFQYFKNHGIPFDSNRALLLFTGFLGAYTTYSTFALDTYKLQIDDTAGMMWAMVNVLVQVVLGWLAVIGGVAVAGK